MLPLVQAANLGDSGFRIFRDGECIFASEVRVFIKPVYLKKTGKVRATKQGLWLS